MNSFTTSLITLGNYYLSRQIDTGDRMFDTALVGCVSIALSGVLLYFINTVSFKKIANWMIYHFRRQKSPYDFKTEWYYFDDYDKINEKYVNVLIYDSTDIEY